ncbi:hypothetical protein FACS1894110_04370 [Spirochaetia bacterium]|nr:hypothetical protein FACS1894110_04370 [Spirochaetia bacterium]
MTAKNKAPDPQSITSKTAIEGHREDPDNKAGERHGKGKPGPFIDTLLNIAATLGGNIGRTEYGECSCVCKIHGGRIASITYSIMENRIEKVATE